MRRTATQLGSPPAVVVVPDQCRLNVVELSAQQRIIAELKDLLECDGGRPEVPLAQSRLTFLAIAAPARGRVPRVGCRKGIRLPLELGKFHAGVGPPELLKPAGPQFGAALPLPAGAPGLAPFPRPPCPPL